MKDDVQTKDIVLKLIIQLDNRYKGANVEMADESDVPIVYLHFNNNINSSLSIMEIDDKIQISGFRNLNSDLYKPTVEFGEEFDIVDMDKLLSDIDSCTDRLRADENEFYQEGVDSFSAFGMTQYDHDRIFGKPTLIGEKI